MYSRVPQKRQTHTRRYAVTAMVLVLIAGYAGVMALWPLAAVSATVQTTSTKAAAQPALTWPAYGQSAIYAEGYSMLGTSGADTTTPIASITKVITALTVLQAKPISDTANSPQITFTQADVERYNRYLAQQGVVAPVTPGESISQYDMMQIMLIASANNYAESLAVWAFGSVDAYLAAAQKYLAAQGLANTTVGDAAGFSNESASTATDLVRLGALALKNPVVAGIVAKPSVTVDGVGTFYTTNMLVAQDKAMGIKTGNTDSAGQCLLFAQTYSITGTPVTMIGAILGGSSRTEVAQNATALLDSAQGGFVNQTFADKNQVFATYHAPWGASTTLVSAQPASALVWSGHKATVKTVAPAIQAGQKTVSGATAKLESGTTQATAPLTLIQPLAEPSLFWRLTHPLTVLGL